MFRAVGGAVFPTKSGQLVLKELVLLGPLILNGRWGHRHAGGEKRSGERNLNGAHVHRGWMGSGV